MYTDLIKFFIIFLVTFLISIRLLNQQEKILKIKIYIYVFTFVLSIIATILSIILSSFSHFIPLLLIWIVTSLYTSHPQISFIVITLSFGISYCIHGFSSFISTLIVYFLGGGKENFSFLAVSLLAATLHIILSIRLLRIKRLSKGLPLTQSSNYTNIVTVVCLLLLSIPIYIPTDENPSWHIGAFLITITLLLAFLIFWWQAQITKSYRKKMELRDKESKRIADLEREILLQKALKENERLARISHRDNTLITTLKNATVNYLYTEYSDPEEARKVREELIANIEALSAGRAEAPEDYNQRQARDFDTKLSLMNKLLHQMDSDALNMNITFSVHFGVMLEEFVPSTISEIDLVHIVDDLLKNAFKATKNSEPRMVQLQFYKLGKHFVVEVSDNGIPFEVRSLVNMGIEKLTTYEDGSGIGLMDIWNAKEKYRATYHLDEYVTAAPFSKKISLTFDKKNRYSIRTFRKNEILQMSRRADLQVYDDDK